MSGSLESKIPCRNYCNLLAVSLQVTCGTQSTKRSILKEQRVYVKPCVASMTSRHFGVPFVEVNVGKSKIQSVQFKV